MQHPTFGYRQLWALLHFHEGLPSNGKAVYRVFVLKAGLSTNSGHAAASAGATESGASQQ